MKTKNTIVEIELPNLDEQDRKFAEIRAKAQVKAEELISTEGVELHEWSKQYIVRTKKFSKNDTVEVYMVDIWENWGKIVFMKIHYALNCEINNKDKNPFTDYSNQWGHGDRVESIKKIKYLLELVGISKSEQSIYLENMVM